MSGPTPAVAGDVPGTWSRDAAALLLPFLIGLYLLVVVRTAWLSDDAFITLRTIDNLVHGHGLRWNVAERVQGFTHPLWLLAITPFYALTREPYFTTLTLSILSAGAAVWLLARRLAVSTVAAALGVTIVIFSKAFVDYSTSGLENALTFLLLGVFLWQYWLRPAADGTGLWLAAGLLMLNRLDTALLVAPALAVRAWQDRGQRALRAAAIGLAPPAAWHLFALIYYGALVPNTALAKLQTGIASGDLVAQGFVYLLDSIAHDPVTLLVIAAATGAALRAGPGEHRTVALGVLLYIAYTVRIGGDFMSGRFLAAPLFAAVALLVRQLRPGVERLAPALVTIVVLLGWQATTRPPITSGAHTYILSASDGMGPGGVADERAFYYRYTGLLRWSRETPLPHSQEVVDGRAASGQPDVVVRHSVGMFGYFAGPAVHVVDGFALTDPFLARLPVDRGPWRIGHFARTLPEGYVETLRTGHNAIADPAQAMLFERVIIVTRGPIWSGRRWREIGRLHGMW